MNELRLMTSVKDVVALLQPVGKATKRTEPGSCVFVFFFTYGCAGYSNFASNANMLPRFFPNLTFAAIDALEFPSFNTEFGIVGVPTMLLFHQGRPIVKFNSAEGSFFTFIARHTGIKPMKSMTWAKTGPLPTEYVRGSDPILWLAWIFVLLCACKYFVRSRLCRQIVEIINRN